MSCPPLSVLPLLLILTACGGPALSSPDTPIPEPPPSPHMRADPTGLVTCAAGDACVVRCPEGACSISCRPGSSCHATCAGGACRQLCGPGATCDFSCAGGGCAQVAQSDANMHATCTGGGCESAGDQGD